MGKKIQNVTSKEATLVSCLRMTKPYRGGNVTEESEGFHFNFETKSFLWKRENGGEEAEMDKVTNVLTLPSFTTLEKATFDHPLWQSTNHEGESGN